MMSVQGREDGVPYAIIPRIKDIPPATGTYLDYSDGALPNGLPLAHVLSPVKDGDKPATTISSVANMDGYLREPNLHPPLEKFSDDRDGYPFPSANGSAAPAHASEMLNGVQPHSATEPVFKHVLPTAIHFPLDPGVHGARSSDTTAGNDTPPDRRNVQFADPSGQSTPRVPYSQKQSLAGQDADLPPRDNGSVSLMSKLKAIAGPRSPPGHGRNLGGLTAGDPTTDGNVPAQARSSTSGPVVQDEDETDADGEESAADVDGHVSRPRKRRKNYKGEGAGEADRKAPTALPHPSFDGHTAPAIRGESVGARPRFFARRATEADLSEVQRQGVSEDEGRQRMSRQSPWTRGNAWVHGGRGLSYHAFRSHGHDSQQDPPDPSRPSNFRRLTGLVAGSHGPDGTPTWRHRGERTPSMGAQKWRQLRAGLKLLGRQKREENKIDYAKSAELMAELLAGSPAALIVASMFQRDERHKKKIPVLLEQLKIRIVDSYKKEDSSGDRHVLFRVNLEYGSGLTRMKWVITRSLRDFANLHIKYKLQSSSERFKGDDHKKTRLPRFPRSAFPYLRGVRGLGDEDEEDEETDGASAPEGDANGMDRPGRNKRRGSSLHVMRRKSSLSRPRSGDATAEGSEVGVGGPAAAPKESYIERQRKKLETYLLQMIRFFIFRPEANRLCRFLELSSLGIRLAAEGGYHGKEGTLVMQSGKGVDFRRSWAPQVFIRRHRPRWFLVRHSYLVCVDSPEEMNIYDVFFLDPDFQCQTKNKRLKNQKGKELAKAAKNTAAHPNHFILRMRNSERRLRLLAKNERQLLQFEESIKFAASQTLWARPHRFESFAPVRKHVFAQWLVDGRDYMWNVSRAISMARDVIYIHDWWLSPELYLRRPAAISQKWRLDRALQRKAQEGVKIFVIMYRNVETAIPIDSEYSKFSLLDLHPNVFVLRSPNQVRQGQFFWAHHEKICIVDNMIAFCGGVDLCFGRWDTPQHTLVDDKMTGFELTDMPKDADHCQLWPGKDYSNPRVQDFYALDKPYEEMYDRTKVPRMPWHDIGMQVVGQPARDLTRHFVQRWNFILRQRKHSRPTPFLLPPSDLNPADLEALGLDGTCEIQMLRSCSEWSIGTPDKTEHSIMNAYVKMIETSEHFVYIENQFFISSCESEGSRIRNLIGDALVERIIRADRADEDWRCVIIIPLMPGFQNSVDAQDGSSIRLIMQCQYRSICRGDTSIFGRLRNANIEPEDYIEFYSLRQWGKIGPTKALVTEQLYIHAKCMIVDDRIAIIGSANINDRSLLGSRDSEVAAIVRDTEMIDSHMSGRPYRVGRFPHTLRMRLMREHLGIDVDELSQDEREAQHWEEHVDDSSRDNSGRGSSDTDRATEQALIERKHRLQDDLIARYEHMSRLNHDVDWEQKDSSHSQSNERLTSHSRLTGNIEYAGLRTRGPTLIEEGEDGQAIEQARGQTGNHENQKSTRKGGAPHSHGRRYDDMSFRGYAGLPPARMQRMSTSDLGLMQLSQLPALPITDDTDIGGPPTLQPCSSGSAAVVNSLVGDMRRPLIDKDCMKDPLSDSSILDIWHTVAANNTKLFRQVFRCQPDSEVKNWKDYKEFAAYGERFAKSQGTDASDLHMQQDASGKTGPPGSGQMPPLWNFLNSIKQRINQKRTKKDPNTPLGRVEDWAKEDEKRKLQSDQAVSTNQAALDEKVAAKAEAAGRREHMHNIATATSGGSNESRKNFQREPAVQYADKTNLHALPAGSQRRRKRAGTRSSIRTVGMADDMLSKADAEVLLNMVQGNLVEWPYDW